LPVCTHDVKHRGMVDGEAPWLGCAAGEGVGCVAAPLPAALAEGGGGVVGHEE
jgi:hypothetical protein